MIAPYHNHPAPLVLGVQRVMSPELGDRLQIKARSATNRFIVQNTQQLLGDRTNRLRPISTMPIPRPIGLTGTGDRLAKFVNP